MHDESADRHYPVPVLFPVIPHVDSEVPTEMTYPVSVSCKICNESHIAILPRGSRPELFPVQCPNCGIWDNMMYGTSAQARQWLEHNKVKMHEHQLRLKQQLAITPPPEVLEGGVIVVINPS